MKESEDSLLEELIAYCKGWHIAGVSCVLLAGEDVEGCSYGVYDNGKDGSKIERLSELERGLHGCSKCRLHEGRTNIVFGDGNPCAKVVFVGEGPGHDEDVQGKPFVGQAGRLLTRMIESVGWKREDVYICNVVKCRPPKNRTPRSDEIIACSAFLFEQLEVIHPKVICALGSCAANTLLKTNMPISRIRGKINMWRGIPLVVTFHPAYLLRNPIEKRRAWEDFKQLYKVWREGSKVNGATQYGPTDT